jgi:ribonuclease P protein component
VVKGGQRQQTMAQDSCRFPRSVRLLKHAAFDLVYTEGRRIFSGNLTVFFRNRDVTEPLGNVRVGFTVGRALGGAVVRNRLRRRMRAAVRQNLAVVNRPVDVVINPKKTALTVGFPQLVAEIERAFTQVQNKSAVNREPRDVEDRSRT